MHRSIAIVPRESILPALRNGHRDDHILPSTDILETPDAFVLMMDLPGVVRDSIKIVADKDVLTVSAQGDSYHGEKASFVFRELRTPSYQRTFNLGKGISHESIDAHFEEGVLTIKLFKSEDMKPREIQIQ